MYCIKIVSWAPTVSCAMLQWPRQSHVPAQWWQCWWDLWPGANRTCRGQQLWGRSHGHCGCPEEAPDLAGEVTTGTVGISSWAWRECLWAFLLGQRRTVGGLMGGGDPWGKSGLPPFFVLFLIFLFLCCFAKNLFTCTNGRRKNRKEHILWHVKMMWNWTFSIHKWSPTGAQPRPSTPSMGLARFWTTGARALRGE